MVCHKICHEICRFPIIAELCRPMDGTEQILLCRPCCKMTCAERRNVLTLYQATCKDCPSTRDDPFTVSAKSHECSVVYFFQGDFFPKCQECCLHSTLCDSQNIARQTSTCTVRAPRCVALNSAIVNISPKYPALNIENTVPNFQFASGFLQAW